MSEKHLAIAARDRIRAHASYDAKHVNVEWDEMAPAVVPDYYIIITTAGVTRGPTHDGGTVKDRMYGLDIIIALRAPKKPRDRERELWVELTDSFHEHQTRIEGQLDFDYTTINNANADMVTDGEATGTCDTFIEPLRWESDGPIRPGTAALFAGRQGEQVAALVRTIRYRGARRLVTRFP